MEGKECFESIIKIEDIDLKPIIQSTNKETKPKVLWTFHNCKICPYRTKSLLIMKRHLRRHKASSSSKIFKCSRNFMERYKCGKCDFKAALWVNFNKHVRVSHKRTLEVKITNQESQNDSNTLVFMNFNLMEDINILKSYSCESCDFKTYSQLIYINHYTKCPLNDVVNGNAYFRRQKYDVLFLNWHKFNKKEELEDCQWFNCTECPFRAKRQTTLDGHVRVRHSSVMKYNYHRKKIRNDFPLIRDLKPKLVKLHLCDHCRFFTNHMANLRQHMITKHSEEMPWYFCKLCPHKTKWKTNLYSHVRRVHQTPYFTCKNCPYKVKQKSLLKYHVKRKHSCKENEGYSLHGKYFHCKFCSFRSKIEVGLMNHMSHKHPNFKDHNLLRCEQCTYKSRYAIRLKKHVQVHHPVGKILECQLCDFQTEICSELKQHVLEVHITKPVIWWKSELCTFKSTQDGDLKEHILEMHVTAENVICFNCQLCSYKTTEENDLKEHILQKHIQPQSTNWFACGLCPYKYKERSDLKKHILDKHIL